MLTAVFSALVPTGLAAHAAAQPADLMNTLRGVESRYNNARTVRIAFEQSMSGPGRIKRIESGDLYLSKPGKMRWDYQRPAGKVFLVDGKNVYFYSPNTGKVEKSKYNESGDLRSPVAFFLGRLNFLRQFRQFRTRPDGADLAIEATPVSEKAPYKAVEFTVSPGFEIRRLVVIGHDTSMMEFRFSSEALNVPVADSLFRFEAPQGAQVVELGR